MKKTSSFLYFFSIVDIVALLSLPVAAAKAAGISVEIDSISPSTSVTVGTQLTFNVGISGFTEPSFTVGDSFSGNSTILSGDLDSTGHFSWTPTSADIGNHVLKVDVQDPNGDSGILYEDITVAAVGSISVQTLSPGSTVQAGSHLGFTVLANGFTNPNFTVSDSFPGSTVTTDDIGQNGFFNWTTDASQIGTHILTIHANDYYGHLGSVQQQIIVSTTPPPAPVTTPGAVPGTIAPNTVSSSASTDTTSGSTATFTQTLDIGSSGSQVTALQNRLVTDGVYSGPVTGYFGSLTAAAVKKYQIAHHVAAIGTVGPLTRALLNAGL